MLQKLKEELDKRKAFSEPIPQLAQMLKDTITNENIPEKMKLTLLMSEIVLFVSQLRRNILHWNGSSIPINSISFCISNSGSGKDSTVRAIRKNFSLAYDIINKRREEIAIEIAKSKALSEVKSGDKLEKVWKKYYEKPTPLFLAPSTPEGFIQHLNNLDVEGIGAGYIYSGEIGAEFDNSSVIISILQLVSELYDEGRKEVKVLKSKENQSSEIICLPTSALFVGSPENILFDNTVKNKFKTELMTKLARRSFFNFNIQHVKHKEYSSVEEMLQVIREKENIAKSSNEQLQKTLEGITKRQLPSIGSHITVSEEARELCTIYKEYNNLLAESIPIEYPITKLVRAHMHWKTLKLSGAIAIIQEHEKIEEIDYKQAMSFTEMLSEDILLFEKELLKEPYEQFVSYCSSMVGSEQSKVTVSLHSLKKMKFIEGQGSLSNKLKELATLASSADNTGIYKALDKSIEYIRLKKKPVIGVSYVKVKGSKKERATQCSKGFTYKEVEFTELQHLLAIDCAYSPFRFENGIRSKENVIGGTKWIALDVDNSILTDTQLHSILAEINHYIVRTSDKENANKFRVILELDSYINLDDIEYKYFLKSIGKHLGLDIDVLPKSQIFFSYSGRDILSVTDKNPLEIKEHVLYAYNQRECRNTPLNGGNNSLSEKQKETLLKNYYPTFQYAFEAKNGNRSISLYKAARQALDLGATKEYIINLIKEINDNLEEPLSEKELQAVLLNQIDKWSFNVK